MNEKLKNCAIWMANTVYNWTAKEGPRSCHLSKEPFGAINEYFDAVFVLTIPRNLQRREHIESQFEGLKFEYFEGIDGQTITEEDTRIDFYQASIVNGRKFLLNEAACALSHFALLKLVVDRRVKRALIFEDDAVLIRKNACWIPYCLEHLPPDWEFLYLGYKDGELRGYLREIEEHFGKKRRSEEVVSRTVGRGLRTAGGHELIHAYAVSIEGASKILRGAYPVRDVADGWIERKVLMQQLRAYISIPKIFVQQSVLPSSIHLN